MKLTTIGLYNYYPSLFDELTLPAGIDRDLAIDSILERSGEFEVLYSNPEFYKFLIGVWSKKHTWTFERLVQLYATEYNPLDNYDRHEEYEDERANKSTSAETQTQKEKNTQIARGNTNTTGSRDDERKVSAFDSSTYEPNNKDIESSSTNSNTAGVTNGEGTTNTSGVTNTSGEETLKHNAHLWGNIGVTSAMELFEAQSELLNKFNMYDEIANLFVDEFCILVY